MPVGVGVTSAKQPPLVPDDLYYAVNPPVPVHRSDQQQFAEQVGRQLRSREVPLTGLPRLSVRPSMPPMIQEFVTASEKARAAERLLVAGRDEEAVRLFAESLAGLIGVQKSSPDFAPEVVSQKIRDVRGRLEKSLGP